MDEAGNKEPAEGYSSSTKVQDIGACCFVPGKELTVLPGLCDQTCSTIMPALIFWRVYLGERLCTRGTVTEAGNHPHSCVQFKGLKTLSCDKIQMKKQTDELMERLPPHTRAESEQANYWANGLGHTFASQSVCSRCAQSPICYSLYCFPFSPRLLYCACSWS